MQRQRGAEKEELFRPLPHPSEPGKGSVSDRRSPGVGASGRLSTLSLTVSLPDVFLNVSLNVSETDAERAARQKRHGLGKGGGCEMRQGTARCGSRRRDRYGEFVRGSTRGIGAANRHKQPTRRRLRKELRRWSARESARRFARSIGAENCAGICVRNLRQEFASGICVRRLALKFAGMD